ncbi:MAG: glycosyltransferase family 2 protein [Candidatus Daviesbacteria bacterium]|nr:glycosyltransferase family 2 protein [Candidatus Daviesbacteria bacterium]
MKNNLPTVSICIPAYNEEENIKSLLVSLLSQKHKKFVLEDIIVRLDASTDKTYEIVNSLSKKHETIKLIKGSVRKGKYFRVNEAFRNCKTDVLVILDADIALVGKDFLEKLIDVISSNKKAVLVSAHQISLQPSDFIGKIIHTHFEMWSYIRLNFPNQNSALNYLGSATAYRGSFVCSINMPSSLSDPHLYIFMKAREVNGFIYCKTAEILVWPISTISDLKKFLQRSIGKKDNELIKLFGKDIESIYYIPTGYKIKGIVKSLIRQPFYTPLAIVLSLYISIFVLKNIKKKNSAVWDIVKSTKKPFSQ